MGTARDAKQRAVHSGDTVRVRSSGSIGTIIDITEHDETDGFELMVRTVGGTVVVPSDSVELMSSRQRRDAQAW
jgi:hypothetical protein